MFLTAFCRAAAARGGAAQSSSSTFARLFRHSKFVELGDFTDRLVFGRVTQRSGDDLYIDFGGKFEAVCRRPNGPDGQRYVTGQEVVIRLRDPEMSQRFLGSKHDLTLLEADADLVGLRSDPKSSKGNGGGPPQKHHRFRRGQSYMRGGGWDEKARGAPRQFEREDSGRGK